MAVVTLRSSPPTTTLLVPQCILVLLVFLRLSLMALRLLELFSTSSIVLLFLFDASTRTRVAAAVATRW